MPSLNTYRRSNALTQGPTTGQSTPMTVSTEYVAPCGECPTVADLADRDPSDLRPRDEPLRRKLDDARGTLAVVRPEPLVARDHAAGTDTGLPVGRRLLDPDAAMFGGMEQVVQRPCRTVELDDAERQHSIPPRQHLRRHARQRPMHDPEMDAAIGQHVVRGGGLAHIPQRPRNVPRRIVHWLEAGRNTNQTSAAATASNATDQPRLRCRCTGGGGSPTDLRI